MTNYRLLSYACVMAQDKSAAISKILSCVRAAYFKLYNLNSLGCEPTAAIHSCSLLTRRDHPVPPRHASHTTRPLHSLQILLVCHSALCKIRSVLDKIGEELSVGCTTFLDHTQWGKRWPTRA